MEFFNWFLQSNIAFSLQIENRLRQMASSIKEKSARNVMGKMTIEQLTELNMFYQMRGQICSEILAKKQLQNVTADLS